MKVVIAESFSNETLAPELRWHCEPRDWSLDGSRHCLSVQPEAQTDFWQRTHYGFQADNGHFLHARVAGDFEMSTHVGLHPVHQYDQAGLMVRLSADCWLKTSVEFEPNEPDRLGVVVTNHGFSDWSTQDVHGVRGIHLRVRREKNDYTVTASFDGEHWTHLRLAHLHHEADALVACGLYACSPKGKGFHAEFEYLRITRI